MTIEDDDVSGTVDVVFIRVGTTIVGLQAYDQFGDATELLTEYASLAVDRATTAFGS